MERKNIMSSEKAILTYKKEIYPKIAIMKAAYAFLDNYYVHIDCSADEYILSIQGKRADILVDENEFSNEVLTQCIRHSIYQQTKDIREMITARAIASSIVGTDVDQNLIGDGDPNEILKDWFENDPKTK